MKQISKMELALITETINTAEDELSAAVDDGWVITTDVSQLVTEARKLIRAINDSPDIEVIDD